MRFATRTFLWSFVPFALLLMATFGVIQTKVVSTVRNGLRSSLREKQVSIARVYSKSELQNSRFLRIVGESAALAGVMRLGEQLVAIDVARTPPPQRGFFSLGGLSYQVTSSPVDQGVEHIATLSVESIFDFSGFTIRPPCPATAK
jgi:hypothetical protein